VHASDRRARPGIDFDEQFSVTLPDHHLRREIALGRQQRRHFALHAALESRLLRRIGHVAEFQEVAQQLTHLFRCLQLRHSGGRWQGEQQGCQSDELVHGQVAERGWQTGQGIADSVTLMWRTRQAQDSRRQLACLKRLPQAA